MSILKNLDWFTFLMYVLLVTFGWFSINAATSTFDDSSIFDFARFSGKQLLWFTLSILLIVVVLCIDAKTYVAVSPLVYLGMLALLVLTILVSRGHKGSHSWIDLGPISFQPAELSKITTSMMLAWLFSQYGYKFTSMSGFLKAAAVVAIPALIIIAQNETGSALVYASMVLLFYRQGMSGVFLWVGGCVVALVVLGLIYGLNIVLLLIPLMLIAMVFGFTNDVKNGLRMLGFVVAVNVIYAVVHRWHFLPASVMPYLTYKVFGFVNIGACVIYLLWLWLYERMHKYVIIAGFALLFLVTHYSVDFVVYHVMQPHQRVRIEVLVGLKEDLKGAGYNVNQSKIAIGSGGITGKGYLQGTQNKMGYLPEKHTDFIFCTVGEEFGFLGAAGLLLLYLTFILRLIVLAERQRDVYSQVFGYCVAGIFFFHVAVNVGMVIGLMPVIGIPLPFFSYGGSSLWAFTVLLFIMLRLDASRTERY